MSQKPSIGRIVHYVLADGQHRAAVVVNSWPHQTVANLKVHLDAANDLTYGSLSTGLTAPALKPQVLEYGSVHLFSYAAYLGGAELHVTSADQDEENYRPGTWHWPERE